jgi:hypothetical protein
MNGFIRYSLVATTINFYTHKITVTITHEITSSMSINTSTIQLPPGFSSSELSAELSWLPVTMSSNLTLNFHRPTSNSSSTCVPLYSNSLDWTKLSYNRSSLCRLSTVHTKKHSPSIAACSSVGVPTLSLLSHSIGGWLLPSNRKHSSYCWVRVFRVWHWDGRPYIVACTSVAGFLRSRYLAMLWANPSQYTEISSFRSHLNTNMI